MDDILNPATGMPMCGNDIGGLDYGGNPYGHNIHSDPWLSSWPGSDGQ